MHCVSLAKLEAMKGGSSLLVGHSFLFFKRWGGIHSKRLIWNCLRERKRERVRVSCWPSRFCCRKCIVVWKGEQPLLLILIHTSYERIKGLNHERELIVLSCYV